MRICNYIGLTAVIFCLVSCTVETNPAVEKGVTTAMGASDSLFIMPEKIETRWAVLRTGRQKKDWQARPKADVKAPLFLHSSQEKAKC